MNNIIQTKPEPSCPICGAKMSLRRPRKDQDWDTFWGCTQYPACKGTLNIDLHTGKPLPFEDDFSWGWDGDVGD